MSGSIALTVYNYRINEWGKVSFDKLPDEKLSNDDVSGADRLRYFSLFSDMMQVGAIVLGSDYAFNYWGAGPGQDNLCRWRASPSVSHLAHTRRPN